MVIRRRFHFDHVDCEHTKQYGTVNLLQIGDLGCEPGTVVTAHTQICHEITLIVSGKATCVTNGVSVPMEKGDLHFCTVGDSHCIMSDANNPVRYFYMGFKITEDNAYSTMIAYLCRNRLSIFHDTQNVFARFCNVFAEFSDKPDFADQIVENELKNIIVGVYRSFAKLDISPYSPQTGAGNLVYDILLYVDQNIRNIDLLSDLSETFSYSYNYLSHLFTITMHMPLKDYVKKKKFEIACDMLVHTVKTVTEISDELSFATIHTFSRAFKNYFGMSPLEYRIKNGKKNSKNW